MMPNILPDITASQKYTAAFLTQERTYCKIFHKLAYNDIFWALMRFVFAVSLCKVNSSVMFFNSKISLKSLLKHEESVYESISELRIRIQEAN